MKRLRKGLIFITLLTVIVLSTVFILPSMLFADTHTFTAIGDDYYGAGNGGWNPTQIKFHFDVTGIKLSEIKNATLKVWSGTCDYSSGEDDEVYYEGNYLGYLRDSYYDSQLTEFDIDPSFLVNGQNNVAISIDVVDPDGWYLDVYNSELVIDTKNGKTVIASEPQPWVRNHEFQCWQVWVNEANQFEFVFVWEYANNNHVQILDKDGNIVFYIDLPKGGCHFVADLPDGTYTVQNYHEYGHILREFVISKP
jgi:hypothetical protein